ncbi:MAG: primosomal protein N' [Marinobacter sp.]|nr:primosomal protein N' [Marinobacter sp.]
MTYIARVAIPRPIRRQFDYLVPQGLSVHPGQRVQVPFGRQQITGLVTALHQQAPEGFALKTITRALDPDPALPGETLSLLSWAAAYYQHPIGECLFTALPPALRHGKPAQLKEAIHWQPVAPLPDTTILGRAKKQQELLNWLTSQVVAVDQQTILRQGFSRAQLLSLQQKGLITTTEAPSHHTPHKALTPLPALTPAQQQALAALAPERDKYSCHLLYGITGSGKTEVYLHYLKQHLADDKQAMVLVPEINLTPQTVARFQRYFGSRILVWHSALNDSERLAAWLKLRQGEPIILIGTRSAVMMPFTRLGAIIVDEEHDSSYKQGEGFRYSGRDLAVYRGHLQQCPVILGSATPSLESLHNCQQGKYQLVKLEQRAQGASPPTIKLLDIRSRPLEGGLSRPALSAIEQCLNRGEQALVFVNRRGFAPVMMCFDCGHIEECPRCDARLTYHRRDHALRCHHCEYQAPLPPNCPSCKSENFKPVGQGTERTEDTLRQQFPNHPIIRVDRDTTRHKNSMDKLVAQVRAGEPCVLVGTQMLTKGHDFPAVTLVVAVNADGGLFSVDFRAPEQLIQTLVQVSGRAGRAKRPGEVIIQTCHSEHPLLQQLCTGHYLEAAEKLLVERSASQLPPYRAMAILRAEAARMEDSIAFLDQARTSMNHTGLTLWGPLPALIARRADRFRAQLIITGDHKSALQRALQSLCNSLDMQKLPNSLKWQVDMDPTETG